MRQLIVGFAILFVLTAGKPAVAQVWGDDAPPQPPVVNYKGQKCKVESSTSDNDETMNVTCVDKSFQPNRVCTIGYDPTGNADLTFSISTYRESKDGETNVREVRSTPWSKFRFKTGTMNSLDTLLTNSMAEKCGNLNAKFELTTVRERELQISGHGCSYQISTDTTSAEHSLVCENQRRDQKCAVSFRTSASAHGAALQGIYSQNFVDYSEHPSHPAPIPDSKGLLKSDAAVSELSSRLNSCLGRLKDSGAPSKTKSGGGVS